MKNKTSNAKKKVLLAFSGGLDTSFCAVWLTREQNCEVHAVTIDTGGFTGEELAAIRTKAEQLGARSFTAIDGTGRLYETCIRYLIFGNVLKNGNYPLSVSAERVAQAMLIAAHAKKLGIRSIAHGSTGAGNDQVRFDMLLEILLPGVEIITPIRDLELSREEELLFLRKHGVETDARKAAYSINKGLWGTSVGGQETLTSHLPLPGHAFPSPVTAKKSAALVLEFGSGELKGVNGTRFADPVEAIREVAHLAAPFGIGRDIHTGDTVIGIKGRVGFEAAAPLLIIKAHHALEKHVLGKWQLFWKDQLSQWYGNTLHDGQYFEPVMRDLEAFLESTQQRVTGSVFLTLHPYRFTVDGISSVYDLMGAQEGKYGEMNDGWTGEDVKGYTRIASNQLKTWHRIAQPVADGLKTETV